MQSALSPSTLANMEISTSLVAAVITASAKPNSLVLRLSHARSRSL